MEMSAIGIFKSVTENQIQGSRFPGNTSNFNGIVQVEGLCATVRKGRHAKALHLIINATSALIIAMLACADSTVRITCCEAFVPSPLLPHLFLRSKQPVIRLGAPLTSPLERQRTGLLATCRATEWLSTVEPLPGGSPQHL
jgi:hypothetical protein